MGLKHKKKRLLDIYDIGKGSGNADFANMTEEEKMQVRKDLGLYYSDTEENVTDTLWHNPNEIEAEYSIFSGFSRVADEIPGFDEETYETFYWGLAFYDGEGGYYWSNATYQFQLEDEAPFTVYSLGDGYGFYGFYVPNRVTFGEETLEKGLYLDSDVIAIRLLDNGGEES